MKAILISIQSKRVEKICSGKKTIEVRKNYPKLETPFKCYIYMTKAKPYWFEFVGGGKMRARNGMVIGEFVCSEIEPYAEYELLYGLDEISDSRVEEYSCVSIDELLRYKGKNDLLYGWHITDLKIYDKPKELSGFYGYKKCKSCMSGYKSTACIFDEECKVPYKISRPPQSWCYVEELQNG